MIKLDVPYYSQWLDVADAGWQYRSCGICALKMAMLGPRSPRSGRDAEEDVSLDKLIEEGGKTGAYLKSIGWKHDGLVALAKKHGFENSFRKEWPKDVNSGDFIPSLLAKGIPVIASMKSEAGGHLILLTGFEAVGGELTGYYANDPGSRDRTAGKNKFIPISDFTGLWKGRIIVIKK